MSATDDYLQIARCGSYEAAFHGLIELGPQVIPRWSRRTGPRTMNKFEP